MADPTGQALQYAGRTYDLSMFQGIQPAGRALLRADVADPQAPAGAIVTGIQKLAQRFALLLLTEQGSMPLAPLQGSPLMTNLRQGTLRNDHDVFVAVAQGIGVVVPQLRVLQQATDPPDEV